MSANQTKYPQLRFKGFTDPWEQRKLGDLGLNISDGDWIEKQHIFENGQYRIIQTGNIGVDEYLDKPQNAKYFRQEDFNQLKANEIFPGDIVVCRLADPAGRAVILPNIGKQMVTSVDVAILRPSSRISFRFLVSQLNNPRNLKQVQIMASGSTRTRISRKNLEREIIQLPNINEQKKIGSFFSILNSTIALHQRKLTKLKELKQGYLQKMFPKNGSKFPQLRFAGFADAWEQRKLGDLGLNISDGDWIEKQHIFENGQYRIIQTGNIGVDEYLDKPQNAKYFRQEDFNQLKANEIFPGDIVVCRLADPAGRAVILPNIGKQMVTSVDVAILRPSSRISFRFLVSQLNNPRNLKQVQIMASGSTRTRISRKNLEREIIQLPNINEQKKIGSFFSILNSTIALHQRKLEKLQELKKGYLQKMFC
ncbi:restriction endonuclease subunit S [Lactobacillus sp. DS15_6]|uniref:restriction endonuclease subunit S n=2 Tax=Lacticaseibacillus paracasei TaxID=1597 RepID=UPI000D3439C6|nr:restriction endonuclease subunit S [Lacticaseibacillus paracasei]PTS47731.1 restriction endonuclease subunit S [Lactobacillus sp. DS9_6]PTS57286.1 restriction endonuclease subunit S [Lactobacillus sp. DS15_6]PTS67486.1 restriction endonuclease subunit S [Lactobacillus sp. DS3_6]MDH7451372.1 restriction endonuclease subunit S [Lacticaseibacillus paracasei subsp. paracasei]QHQ66860.1 restriction endonuclease subunit S [Lacticaseibacillus paracasei]